MPIVVHREEVILCHYRLCQVAWLLLTRCSISFHGPTCHRPLSLPSLTSQQATTSLAKHSSNRTALSTVHSLWTCPQCGSLSTRDKTNSNTRTETFQHQILVEDRTAGQRWSMTTTGRSCPLLRSARRPSRRSRPRRPSFTIPRESIPITRLVGSLGMLSRPGPLFGRIVLERMAKAALDMGTFVTVMTVVVRATSTITMGHLVRRHSIGTIIDFWGLSVSQYTIFW